jgi:hypothetical protein
MTRIRDLTGNTYGRLMVTRMSQVNPVKWQCKCECGNDTIVTTGHLSSGHTKSCGCYSRELAQDINASHRQSKTPTYIVWCSMKSRCYNPSEIGYKNYGGRGITVCDEWKDSFENFIADMGERPKGMFIDRKDNNTGYSKDNCQWATRTEQNNNRRNNIIIEYNGSSHTLGEWATMLGFEYCTVKTRYYAGDRGDRLFRGLDHEFVANASVRKVS